MHRFIIRDIRFIARQKGLTAGKASTALRCILSPSFICTSLYRLAHTTFTLKIPLAPKLIWWINFLIFKVDIDYRARLYGGVYAPHPIGIVIGDNVLCTGNIKLMHGCTLGGNLNKHIDVDGKIVKQPQLLCDSFIGINACLLGPLVFHERIVVSSNSVITKQISPGVLYGANQNMPLTEAVAGEIFK